MQLQGRELRQLKSRKEAGSWEGLRPWLSVIRKYEKYSVSAERWDAAGMQVDMYSLRPGETQGSCSQPLPSTDEETEAESCC